MIEEDTAGTGRMTKGSIAGRQKWTDETTAGSEREWGTIAENMTDEFQGRDGKETGTETGATKEEKTGIGRLVLFFLTV